MKVTRVPAYFFQIEVTTACNFRCFYCIGRSWQPRHMRMEQFEVILGRLPNGRHTVSLQGEGEPLAHPQFWSMAEKVIDAGFIPYTITNGSLVDAERMAALFPTVGVSLDTLDAEEAERIGRRDLPRVLRRFDALCRAMGAERIIVHSVDLGQDLTPLRSFLAERGIRRHVVQPLQHKEDYRQRYPERVSSLSKSVPGGPCSYLMRPRMRFFDVRGRGLPCPYIKNPAYYRSDDELRRDFAAAMIPSACAGCGEIGAATP